MNRRGFFGRLLGAAVAATIPLARKKENRESYKIVTDAMTLEGKGDIKIYAWGAGGGGGSNINDPDPRYGQGGGGFHEPTIWEFKEK